MVEHILKHGVESDDRTGTGTLSVFGYQARYNLKEGFPAVTTKKLAWKSVVAELLWFLEGSTDERRLAELTYQKPTYELKDKETIWSKDAKRWNDDWGDDVSYDYVDCGMLYGRLWRSFPLLDYLYIDGVDQINNLIDGLRKNPYGRRHIVTAWHPDVIDKNQAALPACHSFFQMYVRDNTLSCQFYQRSMDALLGAPFNISSYALLTHIIARECGFEVGELIHTIGDAHIYLDHIEGAKEQITRKPYKLPTLHIDSDFNLKDVLNGYDSYSVDDFQLIGYKHHEPIKFNMSF